MKHSGRKQLDYDNGFGDGLPLAPSQRHLGLTSVNPPRVIRHHPITASGLVTDAKAESTATIRRSEGRARLDYRC
jgi:hypothetical protein